MSKHFEEQIVVRVAKPLRDELESAAQADGRPLSSQVRLILIDFATARVVARTKAGAAH
jgi:hypothetical protein